MTEPSENSRSHLFQGKTQISLNVKFKIYLPVRKVITFLINIIDINLTKVCFYTLYDKVFPNTLAFEEVGVACM